VLFFGASRRSVAVFAFWTRRFFLSLLLLILKGGAGVFKGMLFAVLIHAPFSIVALFPRLGSSRSSRVVAIGLDF